MEIASKRRAKVPPGIASRGGGRKSTNLTLSVALVNEARALGVNVSQAAEFGIEAAVAVQRKERWLAENIEAIESSNSYVERHGVPLSKHRNF